jgi:hypothetical protein
MRRTLVALTILALFVAGACSSDDDDESGSGGIFGGEEESGGGEGVFGGGEEEGGDGGGVFGGDDGGGGGGDGYDDVSRETFMGVCASYPGSDEDLCSCAWDDIVDNVPYEDYQQFEEDFMSGSSSELPGWLEDAVSSCS